MGFVLVWLLVLLLCYIWFVFEESSGLPKVILPITTKLESKMQIVFYNLTKTKETTKIPFPSTPTITGMGDLALQSTIETPVM